MARVKRSVSTKRKRREALGSVKGHRGQRSRPYYKARERMLHSKIYKFHDRRHHRGQFRRLWIQRVNAAIRANDITCNRFAQGLNLTGVEVDHKNLAELAINNPQAFVVPVKVAKDALPEDASAPTAG